MYQLVPSSDHKNQEKARKVNLSNDGYRLELSLNDKLLEKVDMRICNHALPSGQPCVFTYFLRCFTVKNGLIGLEPKK